MSRYKGLFTFDEDNHRYIPIAQTDEIIDTMGYEPDSKPTEPLIKDEKIRKAVRAWAESNGIKEVTYFKEDFGLRLVYHTISIDLYSNTGELENYKHYTIAELCGEIDCEPYKLSEGWH